ncbi:hypothetical protein [Flavobacterium kingsejongi]|uniref:Uncharacterized protein n=1 Tax=Flavobacterium kingsejongi TaxID=1678728 RepID=A0A2S1LQB1_9FLAO|nr:hypothetical protein [Flavobacterium kingsejongi]AWG25909.1 hypothetical protein FK004_12090 [Flavobacterium kingsejongi]
MGNDEKTINQKINDLKSYTGSGYIGDFPGEQYFTQIAINVIKDTHGMSNSPTISDGSIKNLYFLWKDEVLKI